MTIHRRAGRPDDRARRAQRQSMRTGAHEIALLLREGRGILRRRDHPQLTAALDWQLGAGRLRAVLPGIYLEPDTDCLELRLRAVLAWEPDAVLTGAAAARATFWPQVDCDCVTATVRTRKAVRPGFRFERRRIPPELVVEVGGLRCTSPSLTALDLTRSHGGDAIDTVLRTRAATLAQLHEALALTQRRSGNRDRRTLLLDSRATPWSEAERDLHRLLRAAAIAGWEGNHHCQLVTGGYWIDVAFPRLKLAVEVDGWEFHRSRDAFEADRRRQNDLVLAGWLVLRFTALMIRDQPHVVIATIEEALMRLAQSSGS